MVDLDIAAQLLETCHELLTCDQRVMRNHYLLDENGLYQFGHLCEVLFADDCFFFVVFDDFEGVSFEEGESSAEGGGGEFEDPEVVFLVADDHLDQRLEEVIFVHVGDAEAEGSGQFEGREKLFYFLFGLEVGVGQLDLCEFLFIEFG